MNTYRVTTTIFLLSITAISSPAQELLFKKNVKISNSSTRMCVSPKAAWNGSEYGILYRSYSQIDFQIYFVRMSIAGKVLGAHKLLFKTEGKVDPGSYSICANESGWGVLLERENKSTELSDLIFYRLDRKGGILGQRTGIVAGKKYVNFAPLIWTGSHYMIFYEIPDKSGDSHIYLAVLNSAGLRIRGDRVYSDSLKGILLFDFAAVSADGIALFGNEYIPSTSETLIFMKVDFGGNVLIPTMKMPGGRYDYLATLALVWNGFNYAVAYHGGSSYESSKPYVQFITPDGEWAGKKKIIPGAGDRFMTDMTFSGDAFITGSYSRNSGDLSYRMLNSKLRPVGHYELVAGNVVASDIELSGTGRMLGMFMYYSPKWGIPTNIHYNALVMPHKGKPDIVYFDGRAVSLFGKKYALLSWRVDGVDTVTIKTKGYKGKKAASGVLLLAISSESSFQLKTKNTSGRVKAKVAVDPNG